MVKINFIKIRIIGYIWSISVILFGLWSLFGVKSPSLGIFSSKGLNLGIDFIGGLVHQVTVYSGIPQDEIRAYAKEAGLGSEIQQIIIDENKRIGKESSYLIKATISAEEQKLISNDPNMTAAKFFTEKITKFYSLIKQKYGDTYIIQGDELKRANSIHKDELTGEDLKQRTPDKRVVENVVKDSESVISPMYSKNLRTQAIFLIVFVLIIMVIYISFRFQFKYGIGAITALIHDTAVMTGFVSIMAFEVDYTTIAAILFILGYSMNDNIVIFDRMRENHILMKGSSPKHIINISINQTLSRTIITSFVTFLTVLALLIWGGPKLFTFSALLAIGIIFGTYSSIFVAAPVVDSWEDFVARRNIKNAKNTDKEIKKEIKEQPKENVMATASEQQKEIDSGASLNKQALSKKQLKKFMGNIKKK